VGPGRSRLVQAILARSGGSPDVPFMGQKTRRDRMMDAETGYLAGQVLIATPGMQDPRFAQSVVFVCAHSSEGAMGLIVNKPLEGMSFEELLKQLGVEPVPPNRRIRLHVGGPVEGGRGFVLHTNDYVLDGSLKVDGGVALTASVDILKEIAKGGGPRLSFLALGYAGWGPGQLDAEILENAWLSVPADEGMLFGDGLSGKWLGAYAKIGVDPLLLSGRAGRA